MYFLFLCYKLKDILGTLSFCYKLKDIHGTLSFFKSIGIIPPGNPSKQDALPTLDRLLQQDQCIFAWLLPLTYP